MTRWKDFFEGTRSLGIENRKISEDLRFQLEWKLNEGGGLEQPKRAI